MANFDPNQPRNKDGEWTIAASSAWKAAGLKTEYDVPARENSKDIDFSDAKQVVFIDNSKHAPIAMYNRRYVQRASAMDKEIIKKIAKDEKEFYDNPNSTGFEQHTEVRLEQGSAGYQLRYITFDTKSGEMLGQWWNDFCRCSLCRYPTLSPEEGTYSNCSTCGVEYKDDD